MIDQQQTLAQLIKWCKAHYGAEASMHGVCIHYLQPRDVWCGHRMTMHVIPLRPPLTPYSHHPSPNPGEALTAWIHIKVIRTFVEAVLRYGLPVDYTTVITRYGHVGRER